MFRVGIKHPVRGWVACGSVGRRNFGGDKNVDAGGLFRTITDSRERELAFRPDTGTNSARRRCDRISADKQFAHRQVAIRRAWRWTMPCRLPVGDRLEICATVLGELPEKTPQPASQLEESIDVGHFPKVDEPASAPNRRGNGAGWNRSDGGGVVLFHAKIHTSRVSTHSTGGFFPCDSRRPTRP